MTAIEDLAVIGDLQTAASVDAEGSVRWLCLPRFDSPACFAALLDTDAAGHWRLAPAAGGRCTRRRYRGDTLVLETEWDTPTGTVRVVDLMPLRGRYPDVVRIVEGVSGEVAVRGELAVRFDYGRVVPWVRRVGDRWQALAGPDALWLSTTAPLEGRDRTTVSEFTVREGDRVPFVLTWTPGHHDAPPEVGPERALGETVAGWEAWVGEGPGRRRPLVRRGHPLAGHPARAHPRADRRHRRRRHHLPARAAGRAAELGLPVQLAA